jgi:hypothetical protein
MTDFNATPLSDANSELSKRNCVNNDDKPGKVGAADRALNSHVSFGRLNANGSVNIDFDRISGTGKFAYKR